MKDALGHGSDGKGIHASGFNHLPAKNTVFGKRATVPSLPPAAHQSRIAQLVSDFGKSESGAGKVPSFLKNTESDPDRTQDAIETLAGGLAEGHIDASGLMHLAHFFGFLGAIAIVTVIEQCVMRVIGS
jgi:hypothetical protein